MTEPIFVSIAAALAGRSVTSLYELAKRRFADRGAPDPAEVAADRCVVVNQITGKVSGKVVQARDIKGGVRF